MNTKIEEIKEIIEDSNTLLDRKEIFTEETKIGNIDKKGIGFNIDARFSAFDLNVHFDSWKGRYGESSCTRVISFRDPERVNKAVLKAIQHFENELLNCAAIFLREEAISLLKEAKEELKTAETFLNSLED